MNNQKMLEEINKIFCDIFDDDNLLVTEDTTANDIEEWDSLAHIRIMMTISKRFHVKLSMEEMAQINRVGDIVLLLQEKAV